MTSASLRSSSEITVCASGCSRWRGVRDGSLARRGQRLPSEAEPQTHGDVVSRYRWHPEAKSLALDGTACTSKTAGLLQRMPVTALTPFHTIGRKTDRRRQQGEDISLLMPMLIEYQSDRSLASDLQWRCSESSNRERCALRASNRSADLDSANRYRHRRLRSSLHLRAGRSGKGKGSVPSGRGGNPRSKLFRGLSAAVRSCASQARTVRCDNGQHRLSAPDIPLASASAATACGYRQVPAGFR